MVEVPSRQADSEPLSPTALSGPSRNDSPANPRFFLSTRSGVARCGKEKFDFSPVWPSCPQGGASALQTWIHQGPKSKLF